jgi:hypothetical protein
VYPQHARKKMDDDEVVSEIDVRDAFQCVSRGGGPREEN